MSAWALSLRGLEGALQPPPPCNESLGLVADVRVHRRLAELESPLTEDAALLTVNPVLTGDRDERTAVQRTRGDAVGAQQEGVACVDTRVDDHLDIVALTEGQNVDEVTDVLVRLEEPA